MTLPNTPPSGQPDPAALLALGLATQAGADASSAPPLTPAELAAEFPQLEILELLGRGGMGAVYKARQRDLDRLVALKILRPGLDADPGFAERFTREARALAQLNHPGIVTLYEFGKTSAGRYFILMEFVDGMNLRQLLAAGRLSPREALAIVPPLCDALQYAHDRGLIHRDIKPENLLIDRLGRIKIADFGIAKITTTDAASTIGHWSLNLGHSAEGAGTPHYMAPEQRDRPAEVDHRVDLYALGVVLYQMLTGELPAAGQLQPPSQRVQLDVRLDEIVLRALERSPELRYHAASEFKTAVETVTSSPPPALPLKTPRRPFIAAGVYAALVLFGLVWMLASNPKDEFRGLISIATTFPWSVILTLVLAGVFKIQLGTMATAVPIVLASGVLNTFLIFRLFGGRRSLSPRSPGAIRPKTPGPSIRQTPSQAVVKPATNKRRMIALALATVAGVGGSIYFLKHDRFSNPQHPPGQTKPIAPKAEKYLFGETHEITLSRRRQPGGYNLETGRFIDYVPTAESPHGIELSRHWRETRNVDIYTAPGTVDPCVGLDGMRAFKVAPSSWDGAAETVVDLIETLERAPKGTGIHTIIAAPADPSKAETWSYRTRRGIIALIQILGANDVGDVKARYKLVISASALATAPPRLRALDWLDHVEGCVGEAWSFTGENASASEWRPAHVGITSAAPTSPLDGDGPRYLCLWFTHPQLDASSFVSLTLLDPKTNRTLSPPGSHSASGFHPAANGNPPWVTVTIGAGTFDRIPSAARIVLTYAVGESRFWTELPLDATARRALATGVSASPPGQGADGLSFIEITRDRTLDTYVEQFDFVALTRDGRRIESRNRSSHTTGNALTQRHLFDAPFEQLRAIEVRKRGINSISWDVPLRPERIISDERALRFDRAGDTMQNIVMRLRREHGVRLAFENLDFTTADAMTLGARLRQLEAKESKALLQDAEVHQLREARRLRDQEKLGDGTLIDLGARYTGSIDGNTIAEFLDRLTANTPYVARKVDDTWLIQPRAGSVLAFPVTLKTTGLTVSEAIQAILAQSPGAKPIGTGMVFAMSVAPGTDPTPWLSVLAPGLDFKNTPAAEALCRLTESARPSSVWELAGYRDSRMLSLSPAPADEALPVINSAQAWIVKVDHGDYAPSWDDASTAFRTAITQQNWIAALAQVRTPLGETKSRRLRSAAFAQKLPGAPDGRYLVMQFSTGFTALTDAVETVTFSLEPDGSWRASGYFIKPVAATFDPVVEHTWTTTGARLTGVLDLDTGREFALAQLYVDQGPSTELVDLATRQVVGKINLDDNVSAGLARHKIDLVGSREKKTGVLIGIGLTVVPVGPSDWSDLSAEDISNAAGLAIPSAPDHAETTLEGADTWLFRTREGSRGILQIVERTENPRALRFRYKRVRTSSSPNESDSVTAHASPSLTAPPQAASPQTRLFDLRLELAYARAQYGARHPKLVALEAELSALEAHTPPLRDETYRALASDRRTLLLAEKASLSARYTSAHPKMTSVQSQLDALDSILVSLPAAPINISVLGAVTRPGAYSVRSDATLLDALAAAGGWTPTANRSKISILPPSAGITPASPSDHDVSAILRGQAPNPPLPANAVISVPERIF